MLEGPQPTRTTSWTYSRRASLQVQIADWLNDCRGGRTFRSENSQLAT